MFSSLDTNALLLALQTRKVDAVIGALWGLFAFAGIRRQWNTQPIQNLMNTTIQ